MEEDDPAALSEVKLEIDIAHEPSQEWIADQEINHGERIIPQKCEEFSRTCVFVLEFR
jgi:hypothetical protein